MKKICIIPVIVMAFVYWSGYLIVAEDNIGKVTIPLTFPQEYNEPMRSGPALKKPVNISGEIRVGISKRPTAGEVESNKYLVEYFLGDAPIYSTNGANAGNPEAPTFDFVLDSTKYKNGPRKLVVNFWDKGGPSAIGMQNIIIENPVQGE